MGGTVNGQPGALFAGLDRSTSAALTRAPVYGQLFFFFGERFIW
jgi:hypothetical protein